ncbi:protein Jumonji-like [Saccoglossus kowalevskii]|uniref:Protein Jumonji-like n=1 Tax=Saccoglossus kowalevskii TaxID=10224 RepID=A0ABM0ME35_SACKO|nr:PREDICTED: protein Jumonji-like [Saccoglossus kowalevskii]
MSADRPKRQIVQKTLDYNGGILWREEKELRKALYASLQSLKPHRKGDSTTGSLPGSSCSTPPTFRRYKERRLPKKCKEKKEEERDKGYSSDTTFNSQHKTRIRKKRKESISSSSVNSNSETEVEELPKPKKPRVHAQRKFPSSLPGTPNTTPVKCRRGSSSLLTKKCPKTEDFLTFLCLRGTPVLPTTMEIFGAPPSPEKLRDEKEHKHISHDSATANTSTASVTAVDNEDSGVSMDRSSTVSHDGANSPVSSITELITDESTNESLQDANATTNAKVGKVITPVNTHITCHSPPPGIVFKQGSPPNLKPVPPLLCIVSKRAPPPLIPMFSHRNSTATSASLTVPPPIMCTGMSPKILTNHTLSKPKPNCTVVREDVTDKEKESEHAQCTKQGINNINMEDLRVSYVKLTDARHDQGQSNKTKRSKPPKLLYIPSKSKTKNTVTSIDHSKNAEISPKVSKMRREETKVTGESVFKKQLNVEIIKVKEEKGLKERKSTRTFKNHLLTACPIIADSNMDRSVSRGTRNATAKERTRTETHTQKSNSASQEKTYKRESTLVYKSEAGLVYKTNNNSICNNQISVTCKRKTMEIQDMLNPVKRKRGRPPGSKNKSTLRQIAEAASSTVSTSNKRLKHASTTTVFSNNNIITTLPATVSCKANINTIITTTAAATATTTTTNNAISTSVSSTVSISSNNILRNPPALIHVASTSSTSGVSACPLEAKVHDAPVFHPTAEEWQDPLVYIKQISATAQPYGMCKVIPPKGWRPECKLNEDMRFSTQIQYVQMMNKRWGPNVQQLQCIKKHLSDQGVKLSTSPLVAGCEVDLVKFSQTMAQFGGLQNINDKKSWTKIAEAMRMPKSVSQVILLKLTKYSK